MAEGFIDLGEKGDLTSAVTRRKIYYPTIHIEDKELPLDEKDVGKEIDASIKLRVVSVEKSVREDKEKVKRAGSYNFDIIAIKFDKPEIDTKEIIEEELEREKGRERRKEKEK